MIIIMKPGAPEEAIQRVAHEIENKGLQVHLSHGHQVTIIGVVGDKSKLQGVNFEVSEGVDKVMSVTESYKLANRKFHPEDTIVTLGNTTIGPGTLTVQVYQGEYGLKGFLKAREEQILDVEVSDEGSFLDADTKEEYGRLLQLEGSRGQGYPDGETLRWLLEISKMPEHLRRHSEAVSRKALSMAVELQSTGRMLDLNLIRSAALLHDIGKGHPDHAAAGASFLQENGYGRAAEIVRQHHRLDQIPKQADETLIVYLADKMIQGDREVSIEERFEGSRQKCQHSREAMKSHQEKYLQAQKAWRIWEESFVS